MKIKIGVYSCFFLLLIMASCVSSKKVPYFQSEENRQGKEVDIPSYRLQSTVRFQPDDILSVTVNFPGLPEIASDYNLPLVPAANSENSMESVDQGVGRQTFLIKKDGTIDYPVIGTIKVAGYTQGELEEYLKKRIMEKTPGTPPLITVRMLNFKIYVTGEVNRPGPYTVDRDNINVLQALALAGDMTIYGQRDDIVLFRHLPDGKIKRISLDISKESALSDPYYYLQQNDEIYVKPVKAKSQTADISPMLSIGMAVVTFAIGIINFVLLVSK